MLSLIHNSRFQEEGHIPSLCYTGNKRRLISSHKSLHGWQSFYKRLGHRRTRQTPPDKYKGPYARLEERGTLMETKADTVIPREHNPAILSHGTQPFLITCILGEMIIMQLDLCPCLSKGICHDVLPETAIEEKN